ncbi:MAG TPA: ABC transporter permease subunit [Candidatus Latescibacteria bacterium]|nr:ABC transporter permease subunit [Candidatus Latescibacterota bacterium]
MEYLWQGLIKALKLIVSLDREVFGIVLLSLRVSVTAIVLSALVGMPLGVLVGLRRFPGKRLFVTIVNTLMALPTVVVGLLVYTMLSHRGPLGVLGLLFTPAAMITAQSILVLPLVVGLTIVGITGVDPTVRKTAVSLGANELQAALAVVMEARYVLLAAIIAAFGRAIAEVGAAMMVGGNIKGSTRVITTAIALETGKGEFELAFALGIVLLSVAALINTALYKLQAGVR